MIYLMINHVKLTKTRLVEPKYDTECSKSPMKNMK